MTAILRKDLMCLFLKNSSRLCKSRVSLSTYLLQFYSTFTEKKPVINTKVFDFLLHKHNFSPEVASQVASVLTSLRNPEKSDSILTFFRENGFSNTHLEKILKYRPSFISANLEKSIKPKIKIFQDLGFSDNDIAYLISNNPSLLHRSANKRVLPALSLLRDVLGSDAEVVRLVMRSAWFIVQDLEKCMLPNVEFFKSRLVPMELIIRYMHYYPRFLLQRPEILRKYADMVEEMGVKMSPKMLIHAVRVIASMSDESWRLKLQAFRSLGFSEDEIVSAFRKSPSCFAVSVKKLKKVKEFLISTGKYDLGCIVHHPMSLIYSIEKRHKPRMQVLATLESKNLIETWPSFSGFCSMPNELFFKKFVRPYIDEVGHIIAAKNATGGKGEKKLLPSA